MAEKQTPEVPEKFEYEYKRDYAEDWDTHRNFITEFDAWEAMLQSQVFDSVSKSIKGSSITDGYSTTLAKERADRVIAKLPEGVTEPAGKADVGKAAFMDILRQKWIYPNANAQHPFLEKLNMWQLYSSVYGYMPMFYDWNVSPSGYVGPDCWLWNPRNLIPQQGRTSIEDMDYVTALTWVSKKQLEKFLEEPADAGWDKDALKFLIELADQEKTDQDHERDTQISRTRTPGDVRRGVCLATRYEAGEDGKWIVFAPDHGCVQLRDIPNPHKNGRIPFVIKYSQPLFDSFYGIGDFQRAKPLQAYRDGLRNFYATSLKTNLVPPIVANANGILKHTLDYRPGGVILETLPNSVRRLETSPAGLNTYQGAMSDATGALLSLYGSQNASLAAADSLNPSQGRTPAAIDLYENKEATRDGAELRHMESSLEQLFDGFFSLIVNIGTEDIPVELFAEDIEEIKKAGLEDVEELFMQLEPDVTQTAATLRINPEALQGVEYRFNIEAGSTTKLNKQKALMSLKDLMTTVASMKDVITNDPRIEVDWPKMFKAYEQFSDIKGASEFIRLNSGPSPIEAQLMQENEQLQQQMQEMQAQMAAHMEEMKIQQQKSDMMMDRKKLDMDAQSLDEREAKMEEQQPTTGGGMMFDDPAIAAVADEIAKK